MEQQTFSNVYYLLFGIMSFYFGARECVPSCFDFHRKKYNHLELIKIFLINFILVKIKINDAKK